MCPGCPVEDYVRLDVLVSWLPGRCSICYVGFYYVFFPSQTRSSPYINQDIIFLFFSPPQAKVRFKILDASSLWLSMFI